MKTNDVFSNLSRTGQEVLFLQEEILEGKFGLSGDYFMTTKNLAELRQVSVVTAHKILTKLCENGYMQLRGKSYILNYASLQQQAQSSSLIGMLVPTLNNEFYSSLADALIDAARLLDYQVLLLSTSYDPTEERKALLLFQKASVCGIINCVPTLPENESLYGALAFPCVFLSHSLDNSTISSVQVNSFAVAQKVARHFITEGYEHFMYLGNTNLPLNKDERFNGFQIELKQHGYSLPSDNTLQIPMDSKNKIDPLLQLLKKQKEPVGIFCFHDLIAVRVYNMCSLLHLRIPEDVGIVGFDDLSIAKLLSPTLTTVQYRINSMVDMTLKLLQTAIETKSAPYDHYYVEPNLAIRKSSLLSHHTPLENS